MTSKLTALFMALLLTVLLSGFYNYKPEPSKVSTPVPSGLHFKDFQVTKLNAKEVDLLAVTDNNGIEQKTEIKCSVGDSCLYFTIIVLPNDRNVTLRYKTSIKIK